MKEIKFRAWNKEEKKIESMGQLFNCNNEWLQQLMLGNLNEDYELMQFTGRKDKKGKEIYEGDILGRKGWGNTRPIKWYTYSCKFALPQELKLWEVIGNIYDNPELLDAEQGVEEK